VTKPENFSVERSGWKWQVCSTAPDGVLRAQIGLRFWSWTMAARTAQALNSWYLTGRDAERGETAGIWKRFEEARGREIDLSSLTLRAVALGR
jgi:hypothetical protein